MRRYPEDAWERAMKVQEVILRAMAKKITKAVLLLWYKFFSQKHLCHEVTAFFNFFVRYPG